MSEDYRVNPEAIAANPLNGRADADVRADGDMTP
jgi:hypothetical protein